MSCRHDLANGTCRRCYPNTGKIDPGPEEDYEPNLEGSGAITLEQHLADRQCKRTIPQCKDDTCNEFFPGEIKDTFVSNSELKEHGWIEIDGSIYCPKCANWNLGQQLGNLLRSRS